MLCKSGCNAAFSNKKDSRHIQQIMPFSTECDTKLFLHSRPLLEHIGSAFN